MSDIEIIETPISEPIYSSEEEKPMKPTMKKLVKAVNKPAPKVQEDSDTEVDEPKPKKALPVPLVTKVQPKAKVVEPVETIEKEQEEEEQEEVEKVEKAEEEEQSEPDEELLEQLDEHIEHAEKHLQSRNEDEVIEDEPQPKKEAKAKGKYDDMTFKELQAITKERNVAGRSVLKNRTLIIQKLEELDTKAQEQPETVAKSTNKYEGMTIPELKKLMAERSISGRSACKNKGAMIEKLLAADENGEQEAPSPKPVKEKKAKAEKTKAEEDPQDEEVNKKVAELVNKLYKIKKHAKKQNEEFKAGFMDYVNDLCKLVDDYQESFN